MSVVEAMYSQLDRLDAASAATYFAADGTLQCAHHEPMRGQDGIRDGLAKFFTQIDAMSHQVIQTWTDKQSVVLQSVVTYTRHGHHIAVPAAGVYEIENGSIRRGQVYIDLAPLFAETA